MSRDLGRCRKAIVTAVLLLIATPALPDMYSATMAYKKDDFTAAFQQFKELAELGKSDRKSVV